MYIQETSGAGYINLHLDQRVNNSPEDSAQEESLLEKFNPAVSLELSPDAQQEADRLADEQSEDSLLKEDLPNEDSVTEAVDSPKEKQELEEKIQEEEDEKFIKELEARDREVRLHEQQHIAAAGGHTLGGAQYTTQTGPDGKAYAVGGHVAIDTSPVPGNPEATVQKAQTIRQASLSPADPSGADTSVAAAATQMEIEARREIVEETQEEAQAQNPEANPESELNSSGIAKLNQKRLQNAYQVTARDQDLTGFDVSSVIDQAFNLNYNTNNRYSDRVRSTFSTFA